MSKRMKKKAAGIFAVIAVCVVALGFFLSMVQTNVAVNEQDEGLHELIAQMEEVIAQADADADVEEENYDEVYQSKAETVAYLARHTDFKATDATCADLTSRLDVSNVVLLDRQGNVVAQGADSPAVFTRARFNQLRDVFETGEPSEAFTVDFGEETYRYFAAKIDGTTEVVIEENPQELDELQNNIASWKGILESMSVGLDGYALAVSSQDYTVLYHPDESLVGTDAFAIGIEAENLENGAYGWVTINGERYYCGTAKIDSDNAYVICAIPEAEIMSTSTSTVALVLIVFFIVMTLLGAYAIMILNEEERQGKSHKMSRYVKLGGVYFNRVIAAKASVILVVGFVVIVATAFYMQTLFSISSHSVSNLQYTEEVEQSIADNDDYIDILKEQYNRRYLNKCQMAAYILSENPQLRTRTSLAELKQVLDVEHVYVFDTVGELTAADTSYVSFTLSDNPEDQSYAFRVLLQGTPYLIQDAQVNDLGEYTQIIGATLSDAAGEVDGFVQVSVVPEKLEEALASASMESLLKDVNPGLNGFAFAVSKQDKTFSYIPNTDLTGCLATDYGLIETQLRSGYSDYLTLNGSRYYASSLETESAYIYVVVPAAEMTDNRLPAVLVTGLASLVCLILLFLQITVSFRRRFEKASGQTAEARAQTGGAAVEIEMPDGSRKVTQSAASRWSGVALMWGEKTPEQKLGTLLKGLLALLVAVVCLWIFIHDDTNADSGSVFGYVLTGAWERTPGIFSLTACLIAVCVTSVVAMVFIATLRYLAKIMGTRGTTICRLLCSAMKYLSVLVCAFICLSLLGVDTTTLLASAGILTLVVGLGAQSLVADVIAGLFIIFEGEFRVGDIVTIDGWRGTVLEIGVRTTKVEDTTGDVKVFSNSDISGVVNMTKKHSFAELEVGIDYEEDIERVESVLSRELPKLKDKLTAIIDGPFYRGITNLADSSVVVKISAECREKDRVALGRDLNRAIKIIFDNNNINIPFPQVTVRAPQEYQEATAWDKFQAARFNEEQRKADGRASGHEDDDNDE